MRIIFIFTVLLGLVAPTGDLSASELSPSCSTSGTTQQKPSAAEIRRQIAALRQKLARLQAEKAAKEAELRALENEAEARQRKQEIASLDNAAAQIEKALIKADSLAAVVEIEERMKNRPNKEAETYEFSWKYINHQVDWSAVYDLFDGFDYGKRVQVFADMQKESEKARLIIKESEEMQSAALNSFAEEFKKKTGYKPEITPEEVIVLKNDPKALAFKTLQKIEKTTDKTFVCTQEEVQRLTEAASNSINSVVYAQETKASETEYLKRLDDIYAKLARKCPQCAKEAGQK